MEIFISTLSRGVAFQLSISSAVASSTCEVSWRTKLQKPRKVRNHSWRPSSKAARGISTLYVRSPSSIVSTLGLNRAQLLLLKRCSPGAGWAGLTNGIDYASTELSFPLLMAPSPCIDACIDSVAQTKPVRFESARGRKSYTFSRQSVLTNCLPIL